MSNRVYVVVDLLGLNETAISAKFTSAKNAGEGVIQNSVTTARRSLDGTKMILKYEDSAVGAEIASLWPNPKVLFSGTNDEMIQYLVDNDAEWNVHKED